MLSKKIKNKIYYRVYRRYKRASKRIGKPFDKIELEGKYFREALDFELRKEKQLDELGKEPSHFTPSRNIERRTLRRKSPLDWLANPSSASREGASAHSEKCRCVNCSGGFSDPNLINERIPESPERKAEREAIAEEFNKKIAEQVERSICPYCKSSICHCEEED